MDDLFYSFKSMLNPEYLPEETKYLKAIYDKYHNLFKDKAETIKKDSGSTGNKLLILDIIIDEIDYKPTESDVIKEELNSTTMPNYGVRTY
jgi:hypothetical protein